MFGENFKFYNTTKKEENNKPIFKTSCRENFSFGLIEPILSHKMEEQINTFKKVIENMEWDNDEIEAISEYKTKFIFCNGIFTVYADEYKPEN